jgi:hypothetical protein
LGACGLERPAWERCAAAAGEDDDGRYPAFVTLACINIVVAANAGGAFSPFGDITTLMVWQAGKVEFTEFFGLFLPSLVNWLVPAILLSFAIRGGHPDAVVELGFQKVPDRFPVDTRRLHSDVGNAACPQPISELEQVGRNGAEGANLLLRLTAAGWQDHARNYCLFVNVQAAATFMQDLHGYTPSSE